MKREKTLYLIVALLCTVAAVMTVLKNMHILSFVMMTVTAFVMFFKYFDIRFDERLDREMEDWKKNNEKLLQGTGDH